MYGAILQDPALSLQGAAALLHRSAASWRIWAEAQRGRVGMNKSRHDEQRVEGCGGLTALDRRRSKGWITHIACWLVEKFVNSDGVMKRKAIVHGRVASR